MTLVGACGVCCLLQKHRAGACIVQDHLHHQLLCLNLGLGVGEHKPHHLLLRGFFSFRDDLALSLLSPSSLQTSMPFPMCSSHKSNGKVGVSLLFAIIN